MVGVDLGERRIGVAVSDSGESLASAYGTIERGDDPAAAHAALVAVVEEVGAGRVVVGLPIGLDGREGPAAQAARREIAELEALLAPKGVTVDVVDERFTTVSAHRLLAAGGTRGRRRRRVVDQTAATILLQSWLDGARGRRPTSDDQP